MEKFNYSEHDKEYAVMFDAACFLLRSFDLYSDLLSGFETADQAKRYKGVMREIIALTARARVCAAIGDVDIPKDIIK